MARTQERALPLHRAPNGPPRRASPPRRDPGPTARARHREEVPEDDGETVKQPLGRRVWKESRSFLFDLLGAVIVLLIIIGSLFAYTGNWPPLVVVQSGSMQHSDDVSSVGVIDTGDLVFVKRIKDGHMPVSYVEGEKTDHRTYSSYGDVIIYRPNGDENKTAIIHRAVLYIEFNNSTYNYSTGEGGGYDIPSLNLTNFKGQTIIENYEWPRNPNSNDLIIDIGAILRNFRNFKTIPHSGFITKGDDNQGVDQTSDFFSPEPPWIEPVERDWIIGKSVGELPWFGIIKLKFENNQGGNRDIHPNSERNLWIALIVIVVTPFILDFSIHLIVKAVGKGNKDNEEEEESQPRGKRPPNGPSRRNGLEGQRNPHSRNMGMGPRPPLK